MFITDRISAEEHCGYDNQPLCTLERIKFPGSPGFFD